MTVRFATFGQEGIERRLVPAHLAVGNPYSGIRVNPVDEADGTTPGPTTW